MSTIATSYPKSFASLTAARARATASVSPFGSNAMRPFSLAEGPELLGRGRAVHVGRDEQDLLAEPLLEVEGELGGRGRLARALQADEEDDGRALLDGERRLLAAEDGGQLVPDDLEDLLGGREGGQDLLTHGLLADARREVLDDAQVDVGLEERRPDLLERLVDVELGQVAFAAQLLQHTLQPVGQ